MVTKTSSKIFCHDCKKELKIDKDKKIENGVRLTYDRNGEKIEIFKCKNCYLEDKSLKNYQPCEVYSRIVGYLRPVQQWNEGKKQEFKERKEF